MKPPHIVKIGGNDVDGLISIQIIDNYLKVIHYPTGYPDVQKIIAQFPYTKEMEKILCEKWDDLKYKKQIISHLGLDVIE